MQYEPATVSHLELAILQIVAVPVVCFALAVLAVWAWDRLAARLRRQRRWAAMPPPPEPGPPPDPTNDPFDMPSTDDVCGLPEPD